LIKPEQISRQLREGTGEFLSHRQKMAGLALTVAGSMAMISLYQPSVPLALPEHAALRQILV
jgi:hypothetical protein